MLDKQQAELLARMRSDNQSSGPPFRTLGHWEKVNDIFSTWFGEDGIGDVINQRYNFHFSGEPEQDGTVRTFLDYMTDGEWKDERKLATLLLKMKIDDIDIHDVLLRIMKNPPWGVLTAIDALYSIDRHHDTYPLGYVPTTIVDIGAGWGRVGYVMKKCNPHARYIIYDLPESLLLSQSYLPILLPDIYHGEYDELDSKPGCYYLPAHRILDLPDKSADVIVNIASFQEMTPEYIDLYGDIIDKKGKFLYTLQRGHPDKRPWCPSKSHWKLLFSRHPIWSGRYYEAMFEL